MSVSKPQMFIYHLPYEERRKLCHILDIQNKWEELGLKQMNYDVITIDNLKREVYRGNSPSGELLTMWGHQNHTVLELFVLLNRMGLYQGMSLLKDFVDDKYHVLIKEDNLDKVIKKLQIQDSKVPDQNFDKNSLKCVSKPLNLDYSNECNETTNFGNRTGEKHSPQQANVNNNPPKSPLPRLRKESTKMLTACVAESAGATPQIPYEELEKATDNWNSSRILGQGGFGTVFRGIWKCTQVAIKRLETKENTRKDLTEQIRQSVTELHCLNAYRHDNILPLYGYSIGGQHPCLIYQYMPGGSLDSRIRTKDDKKTLSWPTRLDIAVGTARGLQFLHTTLHGNKPLIHGDIKSANILLDPMDQPRIGDFGLAREGPERHYTHIKVSRIHGTLPYLPDEFLRSKEFSTKIDTYSFGVVLFELATALSASDKRIPSFLKEHVVNFPVENISELKDKRVKGYDFIFRELIRIGGQHPCLIYQYMPGGSLDSRIRTKDDKKTLSWPTRLGIAVGTARGLQFLHTTLHCNKPLIHGDIKSANILLDPMDQPRIGDFGLAREGPERHYTHIKVSRIHGTLPYLPDEFLLAKEFSTKIDTYSFGVVLFELATALSASDKRIPSFLKEYVVNFPVENISELKDKRVEGYDFIFKELIRIGKLCVEIKAKDRPEMVSALILLEKVSESSCYGNSSS